jgi:hypothetical protein
MHISDTPLSFCSPSFFSFFLGVLGLTSVQKGQMFLSEGDSCFTLSLVGISDLTFDVIFN